MRQFKMRGIILAVFIVIAAAEIRPVSFAETTPSPSVYQEAKEVLDKYCGQNVEEIALLIDGEIPLRGSRLITFKGGILRTINVGGYFCADFIQWDSEDTDMPCLGDVCVGIKKDALLCLLNDDIAIQQICMAVPISDGTIIAIKSVISMQVVDENGGDGHPIRLCFMLSEDETVRIITICYEKVDDIIE